MKPTQFLDGLLKISGAAWLSILTHETWHISQMQEPIALILTPFKHDGKEAVAGVYGYGGLCCGGEISAYILGFLVFLSAYHYILIQDLRRK